MSDLPEGYELYSEDGYIDFIGPVYVRNTDEGPEFRLPVRTEHLNGGKVVHGGMMMTFADIILHETAVQQAAGKSVESVSLNTDFCAAGLSDVTLCGKASVTRKTRTIIFLNCEITAPEDSGDKILMAATGVWKIRDEG